jgi:hypothetical protein
LETMRVLLETPLPEGNVNERNGTYDSI